MEIRVGFNKVVGALMLGVATLHVFTYSIGHQGMYLGLAAGFAVLGMLYLTSTMFVVGPNAVALKNPLGMTLKSHAFESVGDLELVGRTLWITTTSGERKKVGGWGADGGDLEKLRRELAVAKAAGRASA